MVAATLHPARLALVPVALLTLHLSGALWVALTHQFPSRIDEAQHYAYILAVADLFPSYPVSPGNYLNHPSLYYLFLSLFGSDPLVLRLVNVALSCSGVGFMLAAGTHLFPNPAQRFLYSALVVLYPKTVLLGGMINNDNLGVLAAGLAIYGFSLRSGLVYALAVILAGWTKLTVLLMVGLPGLFLFPRAVIIAGLIAGLPTLVNLWRYHQPLWVMSSFQFVPVELRLSLTLPEYAWRFVADIALKWPALEPVASRLGPDHLSLFVVLGALTKRHSWPALAFVATLPMILILHLWFGWSAFLERGDLTSAQARYYYALWPGLAYAITVGWGQIRSERIAIYGATVLVGSLVLSSLYVRLVVG
jgi:hypothetical protein